MELKLVGRRTYAVCIVIMILALCQKFLALKIPDEIWLGLFALAVCTLRASVAPQDRAGRARLPALAALTALIALLPLLPLLTACSTGGRGRIALVEWDSRSPEQLQAAQFDAGVVYADAAVSPASEARPMPTGWWDGLMSMLTGVRVRLSAFRLEWSAPATPKPEVTP